MSWFTGDVIIAVAAFCSYPLVTRYLLIPVGQTAWDDVKHVAYAVVSKIKGVFGK